MSHVEHTTQSRAAERHPKKGLRATSSISVWSSKRTPQPMHKTSTGFRKLAVHRCKLAVHIRKLAVHPDFSKHEHVRKNP